jgi:hypothetical protein
MINKELSMFRYDKTPTQFDTELNKTWWAVISLLEIRRLDHCKPDHTDSWHHNNTCAPHTHHDYTHVPHTDTHARPNAPQARIPADTTDVTWPWLAWSPQPRGPSHLWYPHATISRMTDDVQLHPMQPDHHTVCLMWPFPPLVCPMRTLWFTWTVLYIPLLIFPAPLFPLLCNEGIVITLFPRL